MRMFLTMGVVVVLTSAVHAAVWTTVYRSDGVTPLAAVDPNQPTVYRDIMAGTHLVLIVSSDRDEAWTGTLFISGDDAPYGVLNARGYVPTWQNYQGSCLEAAGWGALVWDYLGMGAGFELSTADNFGVPDLDPSAGDWFVFDYHARAIGSCGVMLYSGGPGERTLAETLVFTHTMPRDFDDDKIVDFEDLALLSSQWHAAVDSDPNSLNARLDLNSDLQINTQDLALFSEYWLEQTDSIEPVADANEPPLDSDQRDHGVQPSTVL